MHASLHVAYTVVLSIHGTVCMRIWSGFRDEKKTSAVCFSVDLLAVPLWCDRRIAPSRSLEIKFGIVTLIAVVTGCHHYDVADGVHRDGQRNGRENFHLVVKQLPLMASKIQFVDLRTN